MTMKNHPNREQLIEFLCGETAPETKADLAHHLDDCSECRAQVESWRAVQQDLKSWRLSNRVTADRPQLKPTRPAWHWAAAAAILVLAGYGLARLTQPAAADQIALRAELTEALRSELRLELAAMAKAQDRREEKLRETLTQTLGELEARRLADHAILRRDVETVAVRAEDELLNTRQNLARLAATATPAPSPNH